MVGSDDVHSSVIPLYFKCTKSVRLPSTDVLQQSLCSLLAGANVLL